jgi:hypothetical protein
VARGYFPVQITGARPAALGHGGGRRDPSPGSTCAHHPSVGRRPIGRLRLPEARRDWRAQADLGIDFMRSTSSGTADVSSHGTPARGVLVKLRPGELIMRSPGRESWISWRTPSRRRRADRRRATRGAIGPTWGGTEPGLQTNAGPFA